VFSKYLGGLVVAAAIGFFGMSGAASAAPILIDQGSTTFDSNSGLEWLDLSETRNMSYGDVSSSLGSTGTWGSFGSGWRFATGAELAGLFDDAGAAGTGAYDEPSSKNGARFAAAALLLGLLGSNDSFAAMASSRGFLADLDIDGNHRLGRILTFNMPGNVYSVLFAGSMFSGISGSATDVSSFLVRMAPVATTPIPAALPLFLFALGGLGVIAQRTKTAAA
jgi:hypothetical protein